MSNGELTLELGRVVDRTRAPLPTEGRWFLLHTRSRQEKILADELNTWGIGHFLPLSRQIRLYGKRRFSVELPLFAGYLFVRGRIEDAYNADRTHRVARIIEVADQARLQWELQNLHLALGSDTPLDPYPYLKAGIRAEVRSGPLRGLQGFVERRIGTSRLVLQVEMLGRAVSVDLPGDQIDPL